jgi:toxin-antitoxin system PIN domain toxin
VLFALVWPRHEHHAIAHAWFAKSGRHSWATNAVTEVGVLRLLTNPVVAKGMVSAATAVGALKEFTNYKTHEFWPLDSKVRAGLELIAPRIRGYQQWTDGLLLWQAMGRDGVLVTFDSGAKALAAGELRSHIWLLTDR